MQNIWKFSLLLAFSVILDQLLKGSAQSLVLAPHGFYELFSGIGFTRFRNPHLFGGVVFSGIESYANALAIVVESILIFFCLKFIIRWRNTLVFLGWALTLILAGLFSSWLDRLTQGFTLDYITLSSEPTFGTSFSLADFYTALGLMLFTVGFLKKRFS